MLRVLEKFAMEYAGLPTLAFTHFQPAQPTTVGKRAALWMQDLLLDLEDVEYQLSKAKLLGSKGTTGTQASFLELFEGDHEKVKELDRKIAEKLGYQSCWYEGHITDADWISEKMARILHVPEEYELVCFLPVGTAEAEPVLPKKQAFEERAWFNGFPE